MIKRLDDISLGKVDVSLSSKEKMKLVGIIAVSAVFMGVVGISKLDSNKAVSNNSEAQPLKIIQALTLK